MKSTIKRFDLIAFIAAILFITAACYKAAAQSASGSRSSAPKIEMVQIRGGTFTMGSPTSEANRNSDETQHQVRLTKGFYLGKYPVTQAQYLAVTGTNPSYFTGPVSPETSTANRPVEQVTWYDAVEFCNKLSEKEGLAPVYTITGRTPAAGYPITAATVTPDWSKNGYRLPTEAQWEYACRAGTATAYNTGATISDSTGWYVYNSGDRTHSVGEKPANAYGLYDMHGNVYEWCWDRYGDYDRGAQTDPTGAVSGSGRVERGGAWDDDGQNLRSAYRSDSDPSHRDYGIGFRLVRP
jgi:formylglycine-generating enzyme required for sulfatase activity